jgi:molybdate transport system ATP-binding protein
MTLDVRLRAPLRSFELALELEAGPGGALGLAGRSGAGKSTALRMIAGLRRPRHGVVRLDGETLLDTDGRVDVPAERRRIGYLFQHGALFGHLSAWRNVAYGIRGGARAARQRRAVELMERFGIEHLAHARPAELSGGERRRVALARALAAAPRALLLDEPLAALDPSTKGAVARELETAIAAASVPTVVVSHDFAELAQLVSRIAVLDRGRIVQRGTAPELAATPGSALVADLAGAVVLAGVARSSSDAVTLIDLEGGGELRSSDPASGPVAASVYPWEIELEPADAEPRGSALNRLAAEVTSVTEIGGRARVGLRVCVGTPPAPPTEREAGSRQTPAPQPLAAEVTVASVRRLGLQPGARVVASWKATATRVVAR